MKMDKISVVCSPLSGELFIIRTGKNPYLALNKKSASGMIMGAVVQHMMYKAPKGATNEVTLDGVVYVVTVQPKLAKPPIEKQTVKILTDNLLAQFEIDYSDDSTKPDLKPQNNREYWLFTETHQMLKNFQKEIKELL